MAKLKKGVFRTGVFSEKPELRLNLKELLGADFSETPGLRQAIGEVVIDQIKDRTRKQGKDRFDNSLSAQKGYSDRYKNSIDYKAFNKSSKVNLTLTGEMLDLMDIVKETKNTITIGWDQSLNKSKATGHITGNYGGTKSVKRDFFGLSPADVRKIKKEVKPEIQEALKATGKRDKDSFEKAVLAAIKKLRSEQEQDG